MSTSLAYTVMEQMRTAIAGAYPDKQELYNRVDLLKNTDQVLRDGFDVAVGSGTNDIDGGMIGRGNAVTRDISVILTKEVIGSDLQNANKHAAEQELLQEIIDIATLLSNRSVVQNVLNIDYIGDSGIEAIDGEKIKFLTTTLDLEIKYVELYN